MITHICMSVTCERTPYATHGLGAEERGGTGYCVACQREGKNPKTGGPPCGGYIRRGFSADCDNCGHSSTQHV